MRFLLATLASFTIGSAVFAQSVSPLDCFTRTRLTSTDPCMNQLGQNAGNCAICHDQTRVSNNRPGGAGNVYRSRMIYEDRTTGEVTEVRRFKIPMDLPPPNPYFFSKRKPPMLFGDYLEEQVATQTWITGGGPGDLVIVDPVGFRAGLFGAQVGCPDLECVVELAFTRDFGVDPACRNDDVTVWPGSGLTYKEHWDNELALCTQFLRELEPDTPAIPPGLEDDVAAGEQHFRDIGCVECHRMDVPLIGGGTAHPFEDNRLYTLPAGKRVIQSGAALNPRQIATRSICPLEIFLGHDGAFLWNVPQDAVRGLHPFEEARDSVECYLGASSCPVTPLGDPERSDLELFVQFADCKGEEQ